MGLKNTLKIISAILIATSIWACKKDPSGAPISLASVTASPTSLISGSSVQSGGNVIDDGGASVTSRGVCYSTSAHPTIANFVAASGSGTGVFTSGLTGLLPNTSYYLRAFATNSVGTAYSNNEIIFNTLLAQPSITTFTVSSINGNVAVSGGIITDHGGSTILTSGVCYGTSPNPTLSDSVTFNTSGLDSFAVSLKGLTGNTTYYARSFATTSAGTGYGSQEVFTTTLQIIGLGQSYNGGMIIYIDDSGVHGLIMATTDQSTSADWGCAGTGITGADGFAAGTGYQNTSDILNGCATAGTAAEICANLTLGGFSDWYLPSLGDLIIVQQDANLLSLLNFSTASYWSSTEYDLSNSESVTFSPVAQNFSSKASPYSVRAIRGF